MSIDNLLTQQNLYERNVNEAKDLGKYLIKMYEFILKPGSYYEFTKKSWVEKDESKLIKYGKYTFATICETARLCMYAVLVSLFL